MPVSTSGPEQLGSKHTLWGCSCHCILQNSMVSAKCLAELDQLVAARSPLQHKQKQESAVGDEPADGTALQQP